jgi:carbonic anhydrase
MKTLPELFENNRKWASKMVESDPSFFERLSRQQNPQFLWIGCSDSRVPANQIVGLLPGELFVHRNVANIVGHSDMNCLAVLQFAVEVLRVRHIIVCGHYGCGGVRAAAEDRQHGLIDNWLGDIRDTYRRNRSELERLPDEARLDRLCELNVIGQVIRVGHTTFVQDAWLRKQPLFLHGWIYRISDGLLRDLGVSASSPEEFSALEG